MGSSVLTSYSSVLSTRAETRASKTPTTTPGKSEDTTIHVTIYYYWNGSEMPEARRGAATEMKKKRSNSKLMIRSEDIGPANPGRSSGEQSPSASDRKQQLPRTEAVNDYQALSAREFHILLAVSRQPLNGYQISQSVEEASNGKVRLGPATQYVNLHRLVEKDLLQEVTRREQHRSDGRGQRFWSLSLLGTRVLRAEAHRLAADAALALAQLGSED